MRGALPSIGVLVIVAVVFGGFYLFVEYQVLKEHLETVKQERDHQIGQLQIALDVSRKKELRSQALLCRLKPSVLEVDWQYYVREASVSVDLYEKGLLSRSEVILERSFKSID